MHLAHALQNWFSYVKIAIIALSFSAVSFGELQRLRAGNRTLAAENEELRRQLEAEVQKHKASERSGAKHVEDLLKANDQVVELKRENADIVETSRVQQMLFDQTKDNAEELKEQREQCTAYVSRIKCYKQRAERMEKTVADYDKLDNRHAAERTAWNKQHQETKQQLGDRTRECRKLAGKLESSPLVQEVAKLERLHRRAEAKILTLEERSKEQTESGRQAEKELKSSAVKTKSLEKQLAAQKTENVEIYSLKFSVSQLEQDAKQASAKISQLVAKEARTRKECEEKLKAADDRQTQAKNQCDERIKGVEARCKDECDERITATRKQCAQTAVSRIRTHKAKTEEECNEKVQTAQRNEAKARQDSLMEVQNSRSIKRENEELKAQLRLKDNDDPAMTIDTTGDDRVAERCLAAFGRKVCEVIAEVMAWGEELDFDADMFLTALGEWRECYQKHEPGSTTGKAGEGSGATEGNNAGSGDVPMGGHVGNSGFFWDRSGYRSDESEL